MKTTISRLSENRFSVVTDRPMTNGVQSDFSMKLDGNLLRSHEERGSIRIGGLMKLTLGPISFAAVSSLSIGSSITL